MKRPSPLPPINARSGPLGPDHFAADQTPLGLSDHCYPAEWRTSLNDSFMGDAPMPVAPALAPELDRFLWDDDDLIVISGDAEK
jgi:hypothetical protein